MAVFRQFEWDQNVKDADGQVLEFKPINILYGRNYSGKTTLSRLVRCLETGQLPPNYFNPTFQIEIKDHGELTTANLMGHPKTVRVFNEDFIRDNLSFTIDPEQNIEAFAVLGEANTQLEQEIQTLEQEIGSDEDGNESGLLGQLKDAVSAASAKNSRHQRAESSLQGQLKHKAVDRKIGIKYNHSKFGDQNYNKRKIANEVNIVRQATYQPLSPSEKNELEKQIVEQPKPSIPTQMPLAFQFSHN